MLKLLSAAAVAAVIALPAAARAQSAAPAQAPACPAGTSCTAPSPFLALDYRQQLGLSDQQVAGIEKAKADLAEAHRVHCAPMHATTPTPEAEEKHHQEMAEIKRGAESRAGAVLTRQQLAMLASLAPARPAADEHHEEEKHEEGHGAHQHPR